MTRDPPSLAEQIEAVERAVHYVNETKDELDLSADVLSDVEDYSARLAAAAETLKTLEFVRETLR